MQHHNTKTSIAATWQQIRLMKVEIQPVMFLSTPTALRDNFTSYGYMCPTYHMPQQQHLLVWGWNVIPVFSVLVVQGMVHEKH